MPIYKFDLYRKNVTWTRSEYKIEADGVASAVQAANEQLYHNPWPPFPLHEELHDAAQLTPESNDPRSCTKCLHYRGNIDDVDIDEIVASNDALYKATIKKEDKKEEIIIKIVNGEIITTDPRIKVIDLDDEGISDEEDIEKAKELKEKTVLSRREKRKLDREQKKKKASKPSDSAYDWYLKSLTGSFQYVTAADPINIPPPEAVQGNQNNIFGNEPDNGF